MNEKYWEEQAEFRLKIILDLEKQLKGRGIEPYSETREKEMGKLVENE